MPGGSEIQPAPAPMNKVETGARLSTPISMITYINLSPRIPTEALTDSKIGLPYTPVIRKIYIDPDIDSDSDEIVYDSDSKVVPSYEKVEDEGELNPPEEELVDMRIKTERIGQVDANNAPPELTLESTTTMTVKLIKEHVKSQNLSI